MQHLHAPQMPCASPQLRCRIHHQPLPAEPDVMKGEQVPQLKWSAPDTGDATQAAPGGLCSRPRLLRCTARATPPLAPASSVTAQLCSAANPCLVQACPAADGLVQFLVHEKTFAEDRVRKAIERIHAAKVRGGVATRQAGQSCHAAGCSCRGDLFTAAAVCLQARRCCVLLPCRAKPARGAWRASLGPPRSSAAPPASAKSRRRTQRAARQEMQRRASWGPWARQVKSEETEAAIEQL